MELSVKFVSPNFFSERSPYQNMFHCTFPHDVKVYTIAKMSDKKMPFPNIVKLDQRPKVQGSRITIYNFHCQKRELKKFWIFQLLAASIYWQVYIPRILHLQKKLLQFLLSFAWHCKENNFTRFLPPVLHFLWKIGKFVNSHATHICINKNIFFCQTLPFLPSKGRLLDIHPFQPWSKDPKGVSRSLGLGCFHVDCSKSNEYNPERLLLF